MSNHPGAEPTQIGEFGLMMQYVVISHGTILIFLTWIPIPNEFLIFTNEQQKPQRISRRGKSDIARRHTTDTNVYQKDDG